MEEKISKQIQDLNLGGHHFLLAISGGVDSMCLAYLFYKLQLKFSIAVVNYNFRAESIKELELVERFANSYQIGIHKLNLNGKETLEQEKENLQSWARKVRYEWFDNLMKKEGYNTLVTAHHANDQAETVLANIFKGTGIAGLTGIEMYKSNLFRPLLSFSKDQIIDYCVVNDIAWLDDVSNSENGYNRNYIRNAIIPVVTARFPALIHTMYENVTRWTAIESLYLEQIENIRMKWLVSEGDYYKIPVRRIKKHPHSGTVLFELLKPFGFLNTVIPQIIALTDSSSGKVIYSEHYRVVRDRNHLVIAPIVVGNSETQFIVVESKDLNHIVRLKQGALKMKLSKSDKNTEAKTDKENSITIDFDKLQFPLIIRKWKVGDYFYPSGLNKKKKLSKFFIDNKMSVIQKENVWVLQNGDHKLIWVINHRLDHRFRISAATSNILKLKYGDH